jgi:hypothetical protein
MIVTRSLLRIALCGAGLAALPGCAQILGVEPDPVLVKPTCQGTLRVRITTDDTGTATDIAPPYNHGVYDYLRYLNDTQGGLLGCPIDVDMKDAHYDPAITETVIDAWRKLPEWPEVSTVFVFGTGPTTYSAPKLMEEKKLIIPGSYAGSLATPSKVTAEVTYTEYNSMGQSIMTTEQKDSPGYPYIFFPATDYSTAIRIGIQAAWKLSPGRMAMVHDTSQNCLFCVDPLAAGKSYIQQLPGMTLGLDLTVPQTSDPTMQAAIVDAVTTYMQAEIDKKKADATYVPVSWLWAGNSVFSSSSVGKGAAAAQLLIKQAFPDVKDQWTLRVMANNWGIGETSPTICGTDCDGLYYGVFPVPRYGDVQNATGMNHMLDIHDTYRQKDGDPLDTYRDVRYVQGYAAALMWQKAVEQAVAAGHTSPTGEDLKTALEGFKGVTLDGMTAGPISFASSDHRPQANESVYMISATGVLTFVDRYSIDLDPKWRGY